MCAITAKPGIREQGGIKVAQLISKDSLNRPRPSILIAAAKWWPLSARMATALQRHGCTVSAICPAGHPLRHVSGISHIYRYGGMMSLSNLARAVRRSKPDLIVPCDDGVVAQLHALHAREPALRMLIERSLGPAEHYPLVESRYELLKTALEMGIRVPKTRSVKSADDVRAWHAENGPNAVLKADGESGGNGVRISHSLESSLAAWRELNVPMSYAASWKRLAIDRYPLALWSRSRGDRQVTIQEFVTGRPANSMLACWRGKLLACVSVAVVSAESQTGASTVVRVIQNEQMTRAARSLAAKLNLSGFYGLDFILDAASGVPYLIEMNPRCTQLGHIELPGQGSLAGALAAAFLGEAAPEPRNPVLRKKIALFPQALAAGEACRPYIDDSHHDVPSDQPPLRDELLLKPWPQRRLASRIYHAFKKYERDAPVFFETCDSAATGEYEAPRFRAGELKAAGR